MKEDQMKERLLRLQKKRLTADEWQIPILEEEIADLIFYLQGRNKP